MEKQLEQFAKIPNQHKLGAAAGAIVALVGLTWYMWITDAEAAIEQNQERIQAQADELDRLQTQAQFRSQFMREVERLKQRLREAEEQLPKAAEVPKLLRDISYEANQSGLRVDRFELKGEQRKGDFAAVPVLMKVGGSYHEIAVFLDRLAKMPRIVNVSNLQMTQPSLENKKIVLSSTFDATTYRFLERGEK